MGRRFGAKHDGEQGPGQCRGDTYVLFSLPLFLNGKTLIYACFRTRQEEIYGQVPRQAVYDGGFASKLNLEKIKKLGVKDVAFSKKRGLKVSDMAKSTWVYKRLRDFRAGIEGMISFLKRCFGLRRCNWRGFESFKSYAWSSVITANLLLMARHLLL